MFMIMNKEHSPRFLDPVFWLVERRDSGLEITSLYAMLHNAMPMNETQQRKIGNIARLTKSIVWLSDLLNIDCVNAHRYKGLHTVLTNCFVILLNITI